jgi:hypothetical protein
MTKKETKSIPCLEKIVWVDVEKLIPNPKNRNVHSDAQIERLAKIIEYQGFRLPLVVDEQNVIWAGHGRLLAAKKLRLKKVPVSYQQFKNEDQAYAFLISDNSIASWSELDLSGINVDLADLGPDLDIELLGLKEFCLVPPGTFDEASTELKDDKNKKFIIEVTFPNDMEMMDVHDDLISRGFMVRIK